MGTTTTVPAESKSRLAGTEQVKPAPGSWRATAWEERYPLKDLEPLSYWWIVRGDDHFEVSGYMPEGDARLIAAAPDMLAALKNVRAYIKNCDHEPALDEIDAALAKAEGRP